MSIAQDTKNIKQQGKKVVDAVHTIAKNTMTDVTKKVEKSKKAINDRKNKVLGNAQEVAKKIGAKTDTLLEKAKTA